MADPEIPRRQESELNIKAKLTGRQAVKRSLNDMAGDLADVGILLASAGKDGASGFAVMGQILLGKVLGPIGLISGALFGVLGVM
ncbi:MAG: hypothetical protein ACQKBW_08175, partial [Puniceicoccales bacterium]